MVRRMMMMISRPHLLLLPLLSSSWLWEQDAESITAAAANQSAELGRNGAATHCCCPAQQKRSRFIFRSTHTGCSAPSQVVLLANGGTRYLKEKDIYVKEFHYLPHGRYYTDKYVFKNVFVVM